MNSSHYRNFKYIGFVLSHYASVINRDAAPSFSVFSEFDSVSDVLLV